MSGKDKAMINTECSKYCDILEMITLNTPESEVNTDTTAYGLAKYFDFDPAAKKIDDSVWLEMDRNCDGIKEYVDVINE